MALVLPAGQADRKGLADKAPEEGTILVLGSIFALAHSRTKAFDQKGIAKLARRVWSIIEATLRGPAMVSSGIVGHSQLRPQERRSK